ncbi:MAG: BREX-4 system phosphatase PglZ [bacterium]|nr:BREX-4 system phosphatase PglZ [bacterium]
MIWLNDFLKMIENEKETASITLRRFPVRFILLDNYKDLKILLSHFTSQLALNVKRLTELENFESNEDAWITTHDIISMIAGFERNKDYIILSLSEYCRFLSEDEFFSLLSTLMSIENAGDNLRRRIYIPLVGIKGKFEKFFFEKFPRRNEIKPFFILEGEREAYNLYFLNFLKDIELENSYIARTSRDFLNIWEKDLQNFNNIVCFSETLNSLRSYVLSDDTFNVHIIKNHKELLSALFNINVPVEYSENDKKHWETLSRIVEKKRISNFYELIEDLFNVRKVNIENLLCLWFKRDDFHCWLLKNYVVNREEFKETYASRILTSLQSTEKAEIINKYYTLIFEDKKPKTEILEERRLALTNLFKQEIQLDTIISEVDEFLEGKSQQLQPKDFMIYLTGTTPYEKLWIIENYEMIDNLEDVYPDLHYYLRKDIKFRDLKPEQSWILEYFDEYRISRLRNQPTIRLLEILNEKNRDEDSFFSWYYSFTRLSNYKIEEDDVVWIDALSLEFIRLVGGLLEEKGYNVEVDVAVSNLPSITELNQFEGIERIDALDKFLHEQKGSNKYPKLIQEIEIIKGILKNIVLKGKNRFVIVSDHGFTAFANRETQKQKLPGFTVKENEVRYAILEKGMDLIVKEDVIEHEINDRVYVIALKHTSFWYPRSPETHGGATPEEVLVPIIYATKFELKGEKVPKWLSYEITLLNEEINVRRPILSFTVAPAPSAEVVVKYANQRFNAMYSEEEGCYQINLGVLKPGDYELSFIIGDFVDKRRVRIKGGIQERDLLS